MITREDFITQDWHFGDIDLSTEIINPVRRFVPFIRVEVLSRYDNRVGFRFGGFYDVGFMDGWGKFESSEEGVGKAYDVLVI